MSGYIPKAQPASRVVSVLLSLTAIGVAVAAARELWTKRTGTTLKSWLRPVFEFISQADYQPWMLPVGLLAFVSGLVLIIVSVKPRPKTHVRLAQAPNMWIRDVDIARMCTATAERVPGVASASTYASPRTVVVSITGSNQHPDLAERVQAAVTPIVQQLSESRKISVKFHNRFGGEE